MVFLHIKKGDESQFIYEESVQCTVDDLRRKVANIYNGRWKMKYICDEIDELLKYGVTRSPSGEQSEDAEKYAPKGGWSLNEDPNGRRNGQQPKETMREIINRALEEAKALVYKNQLYLTDESVQEVVDILNEALLVVYPIDLPPYDPIRKELDNIQDLKVPVPEIIEPDVFQLWFSGKMLESDKCLSHYVGQNEKTKVVLKVTKSGSLPPPKEPRITEEEQKLMMMHAYRKAEEIH